MQIICISRFSYSYGKELAEKLAASLGYDAISREDLTDRATESGIPVGKLETAILKQQYITEELSIELERFQASLSLAICESAKKNGVVYHGRLGHMVLRNIPNILKIRITADKEERIKRVMQRFNLSYKKAESYIDQVDDDRCRYTQFFYNVDCNDPSLYDITINSKEMPIENSIAALARMAGFPEFQLTPESTQMVDNLILQAKCRLAIGADERTRSAKVNIHASNGDVAITYLPPYDTQMKYVPVILGKIEGIRSLICTMAATNILYVAEKFDPEAESFKHLIEIAGKWNASVELVRLDPKVTEGIGSEELVPETEISYRENDGGILDDTTESEEREEISSGIPETFNALIHYGRAGAVNTLYGGIQPIVKKIKKSKGYCLVVIGDVHLSSGAAAQKRMKRDLITLLSDQVRIPVINSDDLKEHYLFGPKQRIQTILYAVISLLTYYLIFTYQDVILNYLTTSTTNVRIILVALIVLFVPAAAYLIGGFWHNILKMVKLE